MNQAEELLQRALEWAAYMSLDDGQVWADIRAYLREMPDHAVCARCGEDAEGGTICDGEAYCVKCIDKLNATHEGE